MRGKEERASIADGLLGEALPLGLGKQDTRKSTAPLGTFINRRVVSYICVCVYLRRWVSVV